MQEGAAYFQHSFWLPCIELLANIHLQVGRSAGPGMFPNKISKLQWVWQGVIAVLCLCLGRAGSEKKSVGDTSLCPVILISTRTEVLEHIMPISCDCLPGRWIFSVTNNSFIFWYKSGSKSKIIWSKKWSFRIWQNNFFSLCEVPHEWHWETNLVSFPAKELRN